MISNDLAEELLDLSYAALLSVPANSLPRACEACSEMVATALLRRHPGLPVCIAYGNGTGLYDDVEVERYIHRRFTMREGSIAGPYHSWVSVDGWFIDPTYMAIQAYNNGGVVRLQVICFPEGETLQIGDASIVLSVKHVEWRMLQEGRDRLPSEDTSSAT